MICLTWLAGSLKYYMCVQAGGLPGPSPFAHLFLPLFSQRMEAFSRKYMLIAFFRGQERTGRIRGSQNLVAR